MTHVPVLIVGGGTVGLSCALFLAEHGVAAHLVERHPRPSTHPRATGVNWRTLELFRGVGLEQRLRDEVAGLARHIGVITVPSLAGTNLAEAPRTASPQHSSAARASLTPVEEIASCPQDHIDPILVETAGERGATITFGTELLGIDQDESAVTATLLDQDGTRRVITADYLVAADGSGSRVRRWLGIGSSGPGELGGHLINVLFRAELPVRGTDFALCRVTNPRSPGILLPVGETDRWIFHISYDPDTRRPEELTPHLCGELIRDALGLPDLDVDVLSVLPWQSTARTADRFHSGRVLLVGDAAHVVPPTGGLGLNTGIADAHNLGWKLALVLDGRAGPGLLDSYQAERRPVALSTMEQSLIRGKHRELHWDLSPERAAERKRVGMTNLLVLVFGYRYASGAVLGGPAELPSTEDAELCLDGSPGSRLPHRWVDGISTLDLVRGCFTLLTGPSGNRWRDAAGKVAAEYGVPIRDHRVDCPDALGITDDGAVLVRPDDFIAWRATRNGSDPEAVLRDALGRVLGLIEP